MKGLAEGIARSIGEEFANALKAAGSGLLDDRVVSSASGRFVKVVETQVGATHKAGATVAYAAALGAAVDNWKAATQALINAQEKVELARNDPAALAAARAEREAAEGVCRGAFALIFRAAKGAQ